LVRARPATRRWWWRPTSTPANLAPLAREGIEVLVHDVVVDDLPPNSVDVLALAGTDYDWSRTFPTPLVPTAVATSARW
jgi:hypothetical protein